MIGRLTVVVVSDSRFLLEVDGEGCGCVLVGFFVWRLGKLRVCGFDYGIFLAVRVRMEGYCSALIFHDGNGNIEDGNG